MNKLANVLFAYSPKNNDELELKVGDKIEVIGFEEEGWWKGRLKGRIGVFPSNFVQVVEVSEAPSTTVTSTIHPNLTPTAGKVNIFGSKTAKTSLSSNSLNSNNSNSSNNNNNNSNSNNNLIMNNTQHLEGLGLACNEDQTVGSSERRPKPIRGIGYGDIFASNSGKARPLPADPTGQLASERLGTNSLQKQIPKKPPPPTPTYDNGNSANNDQAPALPPKPSSQFSPHLQQTRSLQPTQHQFAPQSVEKARVIYAYEPSNDDELAMEVGNIIDVLDKNIEDVGWWRGSLNGKVGVFPDNFVELIESTEPSQPQEWPPKTSSTIGPGIESKVKSVFAGTPKGFSKELETNLEKHSSPSSFLSLKRNKLQQQMSSVLTGEISDNNKKEDTESPGTPNVVSNTIKLNHITANRSKGPSRRPPSNFLNKRSQSEQVGKESNGRDESAGLTSLPINPQLATTHDTLSSLPTSQHVTSVTGNTTAEATPFGTVKQTEVPPTTPIKPSLSMDNVLENQNIAPKTSQRITQQNNSDKSKPTSTTPPWMVELRKAHAERKRDSPSISNPTNQDDEPAPTQEKSPELPTTLSSNSSISPINPTSILAERKNSALLSVNNEIRDLKSDVKKLQDDVESLMELKNVVEVIKTELKACQSATENQRRYIKELVSNLADERKKIAAMQTEIDRNLK